MATPGRTGLGGNPLNDLLDRGPLRENAKLDARTVAHEAEKAKLAAQDPANLRSSRAKVWAENTKMKSTLSRPVPAGAPTPPAASPSVPAPAAGGGAGAPPGSPPPSAAAAAEEGAARGRFGKIFESARTKISKIPGANSARGVVRAGGRALGTARAVGGLTSQAAAGAATVYAGAEAGSALADEVARSAGMNEEDISDANHRLHEKTYGVLGRRRTEIPTYVDPLTASPTLSDEQLQGVKSAALGGGLPGDRSAAGAPPSDGGRSADAKTIADFEANYGRNGGYVPGALPGPNEARQVAAMDAEQKLGANRIQTPVELRGDAPAPSARPSNGNSLWGAINTLRGERYDDKRRREWFDAQTRQDNVEVARENAKLTNATARARLGHDTQKLYEDHQQTAAKNLNEEMDRWATVVDPKTGKTGVNPELRNQLATFMTEALSGPDGRPDPNLTRDPTIMQRVMPQVVAALQQGAKVNDLAKNPGFIRSITDFFGATSPALTTRGDYTIAGGPHGATFGDWWKNRGVSLRQAVVGAPVVTTDTGVTLPVEDLTGRNVQDMRDTVRRMAAGSSDEDLAKAQRVGALPPQIAAQIERMRAGQ